MKVKKKLISRKLKKYIDLKGQSKIIISEESKKTPKFKKVKKNTTLKRKSKKMNADIKKTNNLTKNRSKTSIARESIKTLITGK